jgi:hypothetical protein
MLGGALVGWMHGYSTLSKVEIVPMNNPFSQRLQINRRHPFHHLITPCAVSNLKRSACSAEDGIKPNGMGS